jgi:hypothetical protein
MIITMITIITLTVMNDHAYKKWLLEDTTAAVDSLGYSGRQRELMKNY